MDDSREEYRLDEMIPDVIREQDESEIEWRSESIEGDILVYSDQKVARRCTNCLAAGRFRYAKDGIKFCEHCNGTGWHGIDPSLPTICRPGSYGKIAVLTQRYVSGTFAWNDDDRPR